MYHWIYITTAEFDTRMMCKTDEYTALATHPNAVPEVGDVISFCEIVKDIYDISRALSREVTAVSTVLAHYLSAPEAVRWTASLAG